MIQSQEFQSIIQAFYDAKDEQGKLSIDSQRAHIMLETGIIPVWEERS